MRTLEIKPVLTGLALLKECKMDPTRNLPIHCPVMYCAVLYCTIFHCNTLPCNALCCTILHYISLHYTDLYCTALFAISEMSVGPSSYLAKVYYTWMNGTGQKPRGRFNKQACAGFRRRPFPMQLHRDLESS